MFKNYSVSKRIKTLYLKARFLVDIYDEILELLIFRCGVKIRHLQLNRICFFFKVNVYNTTSFLNIFLKTHSGGITYVKRRTITNIRG